MDARAVACRAALVGGSVVRAAGLRSHGADEKGAGDYVTEVDRASEQAIEAFLSVETGIPVVGEEGVTGAEAVGTGGGRYWLVDPLDGTTNFVHGFPAVGVSVALIEDRVPVAGAVHAPFLGRTWSAGVGEGAWVAAEDGEGGEPAPVRVSDRPVARAVVGTGFPFRRKDDLLERYLAMFRAALGRFEDLRRPGAAALDLAWVAEGVMDGFFELALSPWDVAAGALLIREAGGVVTDWEGGDGWLRGDILAGSPEVHAELGRLAAATAGA